MGTHPCPAAPPVGPLTCWVLRGGGGTVRVGSCLAPRTSPAAQGSQAHSKRAGRGPAECSGSRGHCSSLRGSWTGRWGPVPASYACRGPVTCSMGGPALGPCQAWPLPHFPRAQPQPLAWWVGGRSLQADLSFLGSVGAWPAWSLTPSRGGGVRCGQPGPAGGPQCPRPASVLSQLRVPFSLLSTQSCLTSALQTPAIRRGPTSARTSWATSTASAETAGQDDFATGVRLRCLGRWGRQDTPQGRPRAWAGRGHSHTSLSGCDRSEETLRGCQLCGDTGPSLVLSQGADGCLGPSASQVLPGRGRLDSRCPAAAPGRAPSSLKSLHAEPPAAPKPGQLFQGAGGRGGTPSLRQATLLSGPPLIRRESRTGSSPPSLSLQRAGSAEKTQETPGTWLEPSGTPSLQREP